MMLAIFTSLTNPRGPRSQSHETNNEILPTNSSEKNKMADTVTVRYMFDDVAVAITFYTKYLGFTVKNEALPVFASINRGTLRLLLSGTATSSRRPMPDGRRPLPSGWIRIQFPV